MFKPIFERLEKEVSGEIALGLVSEISGYHRIQASPGIRAAVNHVVNALKGYGLDAEVREYPADGETYCWSGHLPREWSCRGAELRLTEPAEEARPLALWSETKLSIVERSFPTAGGNCEAEVVVLDKGEEEADYRGVDVSGKAVLTSGDVARVHDLAVERRGAAGVIYDGMRLYPPVRREGDLDDALERGRAGGWAGYEKPCFNFVLSSRKGRWLRRLVEAQRKARRVVKVQAKVDAHFYGGTIENAVAAIPGESGEEVVVVAHICHPQGYANDNASGCGAAMEAARALRRLIAAGELSRPRRTIRFTLVPEMTGSFAWLAENEGRIPGMVAAVNLDMVGEDQALCGGPFIVVRTPGAMPSFVNALMEAIYDEVKAEAESMSGARIPLFKHAVTPFSGGSDHYIYSDPSVGVPCVGLAQWPDKFYHTSFDTLDKVDPEMLRKAALMTATYAYFIADAGASEAVWLAAEVAARQRRDLIASVQRHITEAINAAECSEEPGRKLAEAQVELRRKIEYGLGRGVEAIRSVRRLGGDDPGYVAAEERLVAGFSAAVEAERKTAELSIDDYAEARGLAPPPRVRRRRLKRLEREAAGVIPRRLHRGPVSIGSYTHRPWVSGLPPEDRDALWKLGKEHRESGALGTPAQYWADGVRSLLEIADLVELETGRRDLEYLVGYFGLLRKMGLVEFVS
ncbi:hypothetical protein AC482_01510 [miscellaneous Crenarchaeota group-15 archaeon DG-45]|uniref:DUF4910 domain-containing protein n=1 Tax=miscellaneous Crenarchaeota group-15 archaeon DG-45 TaxID=1685127 RepID=A0A0M0BRI2_9ARCH|nr:MAG: hypothetical protein AC482_01510 [miscellaneous Crenarchaeota group-15 archaeon DG-45]